MGEELRMEENHRRMRDSGQALEMDPDIAAANIQRLYRGFTSRRLAMEERNRELEFIGMKPCNSESKETHSYDDEKKKKENENVADPHEDDEKAFKSTNAAKTRSGSSFQS